MENLISIIVPIYNTEKLLPRCIDSILSQSYPNFELLLVNDGSKDNSLNICNEYAAKDCRIRVFDKPNGGVSSARNIGIEKAIGEYLMFIDADDWLETNVIENCYPYLGKYDIVKFSGRCLWPNDAVNDLHIGNPSTIEDIKKDIILRDTIVAPFCNLTRKEIFHKYDIRFSENFQVGEDWLVSAQVATHIKSFKFLPDVCGYNYDKTFEGSCTNNMTIYKRVQQYDVLDQINNIFEHKYKKEYCKTKIILTLELLYGIKRSCAAQWLSERDNISEILSFKDIILTRDLQWIHKRRLIQLLCRVYFKKMRRFILSDICKK